VHRDPVSASTVRTSGRSAALRLTLAAYLLAVSAAMGLSAGVAGADEPSGGAESPATTATSQPSDTADRTDSPVRKEKTTRRTEAEGKDSARDESDPGYAQQKIGRDSPQSEPVGSGDADDEVPQSVVSDATSPAAVADPEPVLVSSAPAAATETAKSPHRPSRAGTEPAATTAEAPVAPALRVVRPPLDPTAATPTVETPTAADTPSGAAATETAPVIEPRLDRQLAGGISDVGTIAVSVVHAAATAVAQAFGPDSFLGVPYLLATAVANTAAAVGRTLVGAPLTEPAAGQFPVSYGLLDGLGFFAPTRPPTGANDPSISVTAEHPLPVILLNPTALTQGLNWYVGAPALANAGYKVYTFNYGNVTTDPNFPIQSIGDIRKSGQELATEIDRVLAETGAPQVIVIGHSQGGGILPAYYINNLGGGNKVSQVIGIAPGNHGTDFNYLVSTVLAIPVLRELFIGISAAIAPAIYQQAVGSPFLQEVYGNGDTRPGVLYTTISTAYDEVATPYTRHFLVGPNVTTVVLQDTHPGLLLGHLNVVTSPHTWTAVLAALAGNPAANPAQDRTPAAA
jgi:triacylglycerol esterase/lipase EstA (alpha/beta hydrolase family)